MLGGIYMGESGRVFEKVRRVRNIHRKESCTSCFLRTNHKIMFSRERESENR